MELTPAKGTGPPFLPLRQPQARELLTSLRRGEGKGRARQPPQRNLTWVLREASRARSQGSAQHLGLQEANCLLIVHIPAIGNAYAVLSNPEKRKQYDQYGDEKLNPARHGHSHADFHRGFEADISLSLIHI